MNPTERAKVEHVRLLRTGSVMNDITAYSRDRKVRRGEIGRREKNLRISSCVFSLGCLEIHHLPIRMINAGLLFQVDTSPPAEHSFQTEATVSAFPASDGISRQQVLSAFAVSKLLLAKKRFGGLALSYVATGRATQLFALLAWQAWKKCVYGAQLFELWLAVRLRDTISLRYPTRTTCRVFMILTRPGSSPSSVYPRLEFI